MSHSRMMRLLVVTLAAAILTGGGASYAGTKKYTYDAAGRLVRVDYGNGKGFVYRYDPNGNLLSRQPLGDEEPVRRRPARRISALGEDVQSGLTSREVVSLDRATAVRDGQSGFFARGNPGVSLSLECHFTDHDDKADGVAYSGIP